MNDLSEFKKNLESLIINSILITDVKKEELLNTVYTSEDSSVLMLIDNKLKQSKEFILHYLSSITKNDNFHWTPTSLLSWMKRKYSAWFKVTEEEDENENLDDILSQLD